jgi:ADP-ribose pyrophosphatase YjhB (NUDIX family)/nicotinamide mononucleotide adenylyltransferase
MTTQAVEQEVKDLAQNGVIIGRFQVEKLTEGHVKLIQSVLDRHEKVHVFLGLPIWRGYSENPLPFECREQMIWDAFKHEHHRLFVRYIADCRTNEEWSRNLDEQLAKIISPNQSVMLYGGRDSFLKSYTGQYPTEELMLEIFTSGTITRKKISQAVRRSEDFRAGVIWQAQAHWPQAIPTIDIAIMDENTSCLLLARKPDERGYRLPGGRVDPGETIEHAASREAHEETGLTDLNPLTYLGSHVVDDWRLRGEKEKITTMLFYAKYNFGMPKAGSDISELRWVLIDEIHDTLVAIERSMPHDLILIPEHIPLLKCTLASIGRLSSLGDLKKPQTNLNLNDQTVYTNN